MTNLLEQLKSMTAIVADTGDIEAIGKHHPEDATTNPSLLLKAAALPEYAPLIADALKWAKSQSNDREQQARDAMDKLAVGAGLEVLKIVPGRVSTEVDSRLSFDTNPIREHHLLLCRVPLPFLATIHLNPQLRHFVQMSKILSAHVGQPGPFRPPWIAAAASRCRL